MISAASFPRKSQQFQSVTSYRSYHRQIGRETTAWISRISSSWPSYHRRIGRETTAGRRGGLAGRWPHRRSPSPRKHATLIPVLLRAKSNGGSQISAISSQNDGEAVWFETDRLSRLWAGERAEGEGLNGLLKKDHVAAIDPLDQLRLEYVAQVFRQSSRPVRGRMRAVRRLAKAA